MALYQSCRLRRRNSSGCQGRGRCSTLLILSHRRPVRLPRCHLLVRHTARHIAMSQTGDHRTVVRRTIRTIGIDLTSGPIGIVVGVVGGVGRVDKGRDKERDSSSNSKSGNETLGGVVGREGEVRMGQAVEADAVRGAAEEDSGVSFAFVRL